MSEITVFEFIDEFFTKPASGMYPRPKVGALIREALAGVHEADLEAEPGDRAAALARAQVFATLSVAGSLENGIEVSP